MALIKVSNPKPGYFESSAYSSEFLLHPTMALDMYIYVCILSLSVSLSLSLPLSVHIYICIYKCVYISHYIHICIQLCFFLFLSLSLCLSLSLSPSSSLSHSLRLCSVSIREGVSRRVLGVAGMSLHAALLHLCLSTYVCTRGCILRHSWII